MGNLQVIHFYLSYLKKLLKYFYILVQALHASKINIIHVLNLIYIDHL